MSTLFANEPQFLFEISGSSKTLSVVDVTLSETVSVPYQADLTLACKDAIELKDAVGKKGLLTILGLAGNRLVHGVISRFAQTGKRGDYLLYQVRLVPQVWLLSQTRNSRIFQKEDVKSILTDVLKADQIPSDGVAFRLTGKYKPDDYTVEYQESDLAFVSRLSEEDGIWFFFEQAKDKDTVVFADSTSAYKPIDGSPSIRFKQAEGMVTEEEVVYQWSAAQSIVPGTMSQHDFNPDKPSTSLASQKQGKDNTALEIYEHPGRYQDEDGGKRLTQTRLEELSAMQQTMQGSSTCPRLSPGYTFTLKGHDVSAFNQDYLIVSVTHHGKQPQAIPGVTSADTHSYYNEFTAIPASVTLRPPRVTPRPTIMGPQTAMVVGPSGEEIYTDAGGRIKVKFHWDRASEKNEKSSCWVRVGQLWAGEGFGAMFIPRIGQEVIVNFMDGDPDRPIVTGRVYNGKNTPPHPLPASKTKSTIMSNSSKGGGGSNELTFDDAAGGEMIFMHGQKDLSVDVGNDKTEKIGHDQTSNIVHNETLTVGGDSSQTITGGDTRSVTKDQSITVTGKRTKAVTKNDETTIGGDQKTAITGSRNMNVTCDEDSTVTGNRSHKTGGTKNDFVKLASTETIGLAKALSVGAAYQVSVAGVMNETVALAKAEEVGGLKAVVVGKGMTEMVNGSRTSVATSSHTIKSPEITIQATSSITLKVGKATIKMQSDGTIDVNGKKLDFNGSDVTVNGSGDLVLKGKKIAQN